MILYRTMKSRNNNIDGEDLLNMKHQRMSDGENVPSLVFVNVLKLT